MTNASGSTAVFQLGSRESGASRRDSSTSVFTPYRTMVHGLQTDWAIGLQERLNELTSLSPGWDGYNGQPVSFQCAFFVVQMLERLYCDDVPAPSLVPGGDGSLQVEWHRNGFDVELDVLDAQNVIATRWDCHEEREEVVDIQNDFSEIVNWIDELVGVDVATQSGA